MNKRQRKLSIKVAAGDTRKATLDQFVNICIVSFSLEKFAAPVAWFLKRRPPKEIEWEYHVKRIAISLVEEWKARKKAISVEAFSSEFMTRAKAYLQRRPAA